MSNWGLLRWALASSRIMVRRQDCRILAPCSHKWLRKPKRYTNRQLQTFLEKWTNFRWLDRAFQTRICTEMSGSAINRDLRWTIYRSSKLRILLASATTSWTSCRSSQRLRWRKPSHQRQWEKDWSMTQKRVILQECIIKIQTCRHP